MITEILSQKIEDTIFSIFDTETTGDNSTNEDKPIEIAVVPFNLINGFLDKPFSRLIDPQRLIHPSAIAVHGIQDKDLIGKPLLENVLPEFIEYTKNTVYVAHNIAFDLNMLPSIKELENPKLDTLRFARHIFKIGDLNSKNQDLRSHKSQELRYWLELEVDTMGQQAHRAAADILVTGEVFKATLKKFLATTYSTTLEELLEFINAPIISEKMNFGKYKNVNIQEAISIEIKKSNNYFAWILKSHHSGEFKIDEDLKYSIEYYLKKINIDPVALLVEGNNKNWKDISTQTKFKAK